jgi:hypothetical protein
MTDFVRDHVRLREVALRGEIGFELPEEGEIDVHVLIGGTIERAGRGRRGAAAGVDAIIEQPQAGLRILAAGLLEQRGPRFFGVAEHVRNELAGFVARRAGRDRRFCLRGRAGAAEQTHDELRPADEVRDDRDDDAADAERYSAPAAAAARAATTEIFYVPALFALAPTHAADVSRGSRGMIRAS